MKKAFIIRAIIILSIWIPVAIWAFHYAFLEKQGARFDFMLESNGRVSILQQEQWTESVLPNDRLISVAGKNFRLQDTKDWLRQQNPGKTFEAIVERNHREIPVTLTLKRYTKNGFLLLFTLPFILSVIFLLFGLGVPLQPVAFRKAREAVEVFSVLCVVASLFFLLHLPTSSLGTHFSFSLVIPVVGMLIVHLFVVYPKKKGSIKIRSALLGIGYVGALGLGAYRLGTWLLPHQSWIHQINLPILGACSLIAMGSLGNTLLTSKDFWARRRARLMSLVFGVSFIGALSAFVAAIWDMPRLSWERLLAASLFFPTAFAFVFLKNNVFDLERMFRRGLHQLLLLAMAVTFALLVGVGWSQWQIAPEQDWMLWGAIAIVVVALARPVGQWFENAVHHLIKTRVRYPQVNEFFEASKTLEQFFLALAQHCETHLKMEDLSIRCFSDPTKPWTEKNEQCWSYEQGRLKRLMTTMKIGQSRYVFRMTRGEFPIGELSFSGSDSMAFDPNISKEWVDTIRSVARCTELLCLRDFISIQQGFLAVGRMQSLLAHEMKNPLAIIKVCSGLLSSHVYGNDEAEELLKTIQGEVKRVASGVQNIFDSSSRSNQSERVNVGLLLSQIKESVQSRFPKADIQISYWQNGELKEVKDGFFWLWIDKEGLRQSLLNLVVNALEAGSPWVGIEVHQSDDNISLVVKDRGPGIPEGVDLFKPFVTTKSHGSGLGLAHVKSFVDRNMGQIRVSSKRGDGTTFMMELPQTLVQPS